MLIDRYSLVVKKPNCLSRQETELLSSGRMAAFGKLCGGTADCAKGGFGPEMTIGSVAPTVNVGSKCKFAAL